MTFKNFLVPALAVLAVVILLFVGPIPQKVSYHQFADQRTIASISNFWNVISNLPFVLIAVWGISTSRQLHDKRLKLMSYFIFAGFFVLTYGSGYYGSSKKVRECPLSFLQAIKFRSSAHLRLAGWASFFCLTKRTKSQVLR